jgi:DNA-binding HxlR family transcriptional regulator
VPYALYGVRRFNDFQTHLDIPKAVLAERLNELVEHGILKRVPDSEHAGRHLYELTASGRALWPVLHSLLVWGGKHRPPTAGSSRHAGCRTRLDDNGRCPGCGATPEPEDILTEPRRGHRTERDDPVAVALRAPHRLLEPIET